MPLRALVLFSALILTLSMGYQARGESSYSKISFDKLINLSTLNSFLLLNTQQKMTYLNQLGIDVFKVKNIEHKTPLLSFLPDIEDQSQLQRYQEMFQKNVSGLFLTENASFNEIKKPTLIFIDYANDWTIAHEFSHYLLDRARLSSYTEDESHALNSLQDAKEDYFENRSSLLAEGKFRNDNHKRALINSFITFSERQQQILLTFDMEEVAVEMLLRSIYLKNQDIGLDTESFNRSSEYIQRTGSKSLKLMNVLLDLCTETKAHLSPPQDQDLMTSLETTCSTAAKYKNQLLKISSSLSKAFDQ